ncbi:hypothetical protein Y1Q_0017762 [Alligator mississippiensis]|uniref:Uncharacterized protein n=1 Tax=Alligator mississippiensis TaxID=8496 RepID=A0A151MJG7_ALLMI|nr:hypothetical protein Y1Q_0017762 [Alligator mississippiensis]
MDCTVLLQSLLAVSEECVEDCLSGQVEDVACKDMWAQSKLTWDQVGLELLEEKVGWKVAWASRNMSSDCLLSLVCRMMCHHQS